jgi:hypothetical protein
MVLSNGGKIFGEANILRYLHSLLPKNVNISTLDFFSQTVFNEWIDRCTNTLNYTSNETKPNLNSYLSSLNTHLSKNKKSFLSEIDEPSICDFYTWSCLIQNRNLINNNFSSVNEWLIKFESQLPILNGIKKNIYSN